MMLSIQGKRAFENNNWFWSIFKCNWIICWLQIFLFFTDNNSISFLIIIIENEQVNFLNRITEKYTIFFDILIIIIINKYKIK